MPVSVTITGLADWEKITDPVRLRAGLDKALDYAVERLRDDTKKLPPVSKATTGFEQPGIPVDTGRMRQSIQKRKIALLAAEVYVGANYGGFVHDGTSKLPPRPFFSWLIDDFGGRETIDTIFEEALEDLLKP